MSNDKEQDLIEDAEILQTLDHLSEVMETIRDTIDQLKMDVVDAQQTIVDRYRTEPEILEPEMAEVEVNAKTKTHNHVQAQEDTQEIIYEAPTIIH